jgi:hypothetical protein
MFAMSMEACRTRMLARALVAVSPEAPYPALLRAAAADVARAAAKFASASKRSEMGLNADAAAAGVDGDVNVDSLFEGDVFACCTAQMSTQQLLQLVEELILMCAREQKLGRQRHVAAAAKTVCSHIKSGLDAISVLVLLMYPPPSADSLSMLEACFMPLLSVCPQVVDAHFSFCCIRSQAVLLVQIPHFHAGVQPVAGYSHGIAR